MAITKPPGVESDAFKSAKWDELTAGRDFSQSDAPALELLCMWYEIAQQAQDEWASFGRQTAYQNDMGDLKSFPQIDTLKKSTDQIRQLSKQLGLCDTHETREEHGNQPATVLSIVTARRAQRKSGTA